MLKAWRISRLGEDARKVEKMLNYQWKLQTENATAKADRGVSVVETRNFFVYFLSWQVVFANTLHTVCTYTHMRADVNERIYICNSLGSQS